MEVKNVNPSFLKTLTRGLETLVTVNNKCFYILEHHVSSKYHLEGEQQQIFLDEIFLGRDIDCQVRFDETFNTVSHHHASIIREDSNWKLVQKSQKNSTFLNGKPINDSWYLQHGDEIQLALNGPKLTFLIPKETEQVKFLERLQSFREQVIRPYQTAFIVMCAVVVLIIAGCVLLGVYVNTQNKKIKAANELIEQLQVQNEEIYYNLQESIDRQNELAIKADSAERKRIQIEADLYKQRLKELELEKDVNKKTKDLQKLQKEMRNLQRKIDNINTDN